jgi:hypothetical protein
VVFFLIKFQTTKQNNKTMTKSMKNSELAEKFAAQVASGSTFIVAKEQTKNPDYVMLYLAQAVTVGNDKESTTNFFLGWNNERIVRAMHNSAKTIADKLKEGQIVPFDILIEEKTFPQWEGQQSKVNPSTGQEIEFQGMPVYEHSSLVAVGQGGIVKLVGAVSQTASAAFFRAAELVENSNKETAKF